MGHISRKKRLARMMRMGNSTQPRIVLCEDKTEKDIHTHQGFDFLWLGYRDGHKISLFADFMHRKLSFTKHRLSVHQLKMSNKCVNIL